jgi:Skp family chaperone for outer membrane proteins
VPDEPTLGEVKRRVEAGFIDVKEDIKNLVEALDRRVSMERYQLEKEARDKEIKEILERVRAIEEARRKHAEQRELDRRAAAAQRAADRRLILTALIVPVLLVVLQVYLSAKGAGS